MDESLRTCLTFIEGIGLEVAWKSRLPHAIVPGFAIENGVLNICEVEILCPGDILHEAAHLAVIPSNERASLSNDNIGNREHSEAEEIMCIAWSYAACLHLKLEPEFVFHPHGYKGGGTYLADNFREGRYLGVPMLQYAGMTLERAQGDQTAYPAMIKWLRD